jgi:hypothetical protein
MPEVYITAEATELDVGPATVLTFRLAAADVLVLLGKERDTDTELSDPDLLKRAAEKVLAGVTTTGGNPRSIGGELDGNHVFLYAAGPEGMDVTDAKVLSSVFDAWTNIYADERSDVATRMFTQSGEHRH